MTIQTSSSAFFLRRVIWTAWIMLTLPLFISIANAAFFIDDRATFNASLTENPTETIIDSAANFAADPAVASGLASITRSGMIGASNYTYVIYDIDFSNTPTGMLTPGSIGGDINDLDNINTEQPASQGGATGTGSWGVDTVTGQNSTRNALLFDFTSTPGGLGIGHFGVDLHDFESAASGLLGEFRIYNGGTLIDQGSIDWGLGNNGNGESHFFGYIVEETADLFDQIVIVVGDDNASGTGFFERLAADNFTFGSAFSAVDFGDAAGFSSARHVRRLSEAHLGSNPGDADPVSSPQTNVTATADNINGVDDEDGVSFSTMTGGAAVITATISVTNPTGTTVTLCAWLDVDTSNSFDLSERQCNTAINPGTSFNWTVNGTLTQNYYSRFRVCALIAECEIPNGSAAGGEVEDYRVTFNPTAATIGQVKLRATNLADLLSGINIEQMDQAALLGLLQIWNPPLAALLNNSSRTILILALKDYLDPDGDNQVAVLQWDTLAERGTIGFFVRRSDGNNNWVVINDDMLPGLISAPMGGEYMLIDPEARVGTVYHYQLIEQEADGNRRHYGPYTVEMN